MKNRKNLYIGIATGLALACIWSGSKIFQTIGQKKLTNEDEIGKKFDSSAQYFTINN
jgi:predicted membrane-bound dolichyl-phosphate-mannose-protein mannosyltransferase